MVLYSECESIVYFIELTILFEDAMEETFKIFWTGSGEVGKHIQDQLR